MFSVIEEEVPAIKHQDLFRRAGPIPELRLEGLFQPNTPSLVLRSPETSTSSSASQVTSCGPKDTTGPCERMVSASSNNTTIPIVLGVVIPLTVAFVTMIYLHRRHVRKLRREDAEDADKSLDFGLDGSPAKGKKSKSRSKGKKGGQKVPEMSVTDAQGAVRGDRGVSLDLGAANPYLLPPELQSSRESLHSLSRSINPGDDRYRTTSFVPDDGSVRSPSSLRSHWDDSSTVYTSSSRKKMDSESTKGLVPQPLVKISEMPSLTFKHSAALKDGNSLLAPRLQDPVRESYLSTTSSNGAVAALRASNNYLGQFISGGQASKVRGQVEKENAGASVMELEGSSPIQEPPPAKVMDAPSKRRSDVPEAVTAFNFDVASNPHASQGQKPTMYHELATEKESYLPQFSVTPSDNLAAKRQSSVYEDKLDEFPHFSQQADKTVKRASVAPPNGTSVPQHSQPIDQGQPGSLQPHMDVPSQRESEYYEDEEVHDMEDYRDVLGYDPRMLGMGQRPLPPDDPSENPEERALKIRSFYKEYFDDSAKPGGPAARVSYYDGSENYIDDYYRTNASTPHGSRGPTAADRPLQTRHRATISNSAYRGPGPKAHSSASGLMGPTRLPPKKNLPAPSPLQVLPTPSRLQEDSMLPNAIDYAPPQVFKNQRSGTPDSLRGGQRPYSPGMKVHNPLVSSFDDLAALPSPHALRKSGTFTSLDFAPPRFVPADGNASETGSIRSTRSGVSAVHQHNIRNGAYRVSRIPKEVAGTRDELSMSLRPQWDMSRK